MKLTELQEARLPVLEAREKNRAKEDTKTKAMNEAKFNKQLRRFNRAITAGMTTKKEMTAAKKELDTLEAEQ